MFALGCRCSRKGTATAGVPRKIVFIMSTHCSLFSTENEYLEQALFAAAGDIAFDAQALDDRQPIDVKPAVQVVDFVLQAAGQESFSINHDRQSVLIKRAHADFRSPLNLRRKTGDRKTPFFFIK